MNKDNLMDAMNYIDLELVEEADVGAAARKRKRWGHPGLIAACLCLVLAGTALAAELAGVYVSDFFEGRDTDEEGVDFDFLGYNIHIGGIRRIPVASLAPGVLEYIEETRSSDGFYFIQKATNSKEEAEEFLGLHLPDNPVLDQAFGGTIGFYTGDNGGKNKSDFIAMTPTTATGVIGLSGVGRSLQDIHVKLAYNVYQTEWTEIGWRTRIEYMPVTVTAMIYTDGSYAAIEEEGTDFDMRLRQNEYAEWVALEKYSYATPNGLETSIMATTSSYEDSSGEQAAIYHYAAYFALEGIFYEVEGRYSNEAMARETIEQILDAFADESSTEA